MQVTALILLSLALALSAYAYWRWKEKKTDENWRETILYWSFFDPPGGSATPLTNTTWLLEQLPKPSSAWNLKYLSSFHGLNMKESLDCYKFMEPWLCRTVHVQTVQTVQMKLPVSTIYLPASCWPTCCLDSFILCFTVLMLALQISGPVIKLFESTITEWVLLSKTPLPNSSILSPLNASNALK